MFELLISVSGIGAKSAITMLSNITPSSFALAVITNDVHKLTKIPGIGPKSAQRIILELKDKLKNVEITNLDSEEERVVVSNTENAHTKVSLNVLLAIANALDTTVDNLLVNQYQNSSLALDNEILRAVKNCDNAKKEKILKMIEIL